MAFIIILFKSYPYSRTVLARSLIWTFFQTKRSEFFFYQAKGGFEPHKPPPFDTPLSELHKTPAFHILAIILVYLLRNINFYQIGGKLKPLIKRLRSYIMLLNHLIILIIGESRKYLEEVLI